MCSPISRRRRHRVRNTGRGAVRGGMGVQRGASRGGGPPRGLYTNNMNPCPRPQLVNFVCTCTTNGKYYNNGRKKIEKKYKLRRVSSQSSVVIVTYSSKQASFTVQFRRNCFKCFFFSLFPRWSFKVKRKPGNL